MGHGIRKTSNASCQACQPILITDLGSNKYISRLCRCRFSWLLSESRFYPSNGNVRTRYVNSSTRGNSQYIYGICLFLPKYQHLLRIISGITGLLIPALLITVLPVTEGAYITMSEGKEVLLYGKLLSSPVIYCYMLFGLTSELFLSSLFLADFAREQGSEDAYRIYRRNAIILGPATLVTAIIALVVMDPETHWLMQGLIKQFTWFTVSIVLFIIGYSSLWWTNKKYDTLGYPRIAVLAVVAQYAFASYAYGVAHLPYIIYPDVTVFTSFTTVETFYALLILYAIGIAILLPGFIFFWNLFLKDRTFEGKIIL